MGAATLTKQLRKIRRFHSKKSGCRCCVVGCANTWLSRAKWSWAVLSTGIFV